MQLATLTAEEFRKFAAKSPYQSFMQTPEIAKYREDNGWTAHYLGLKDSNKIKATTLLVSKTTFLGKATFIAPGGPLLDFEDKSLAKKFLSSLKSYAKSHNGYILQISPYYELIQRDRQGEIMANGFDHSSALSVLKNLGFTEIEHASQPKYMFVLDIAGRTEDQILADMKSNTRNHIRKAEKMGVKVRELKREELNILKQITESTSARRGFTDRPLSYYQEMYDLFYPRNEIKFFVAEANGIPMSAAMFMLVGNEVVYLFSGSYEEYMHDYNAQYLIQWEIIKYAAKHGFSRYNFYGINSLPGQSPKDEGIYTFKKGFTSDDTGRVIEFIGTFEAPIIPSIYHLHSFLMRIRRK